MNRIPLLTAALALLLSACSDGQLGDKGLVRFSQITNFAETSDFTPAIVTGRTVLVALQRPSEAEHTYAELDLVVTGNDATVMPLGFAQYAVQPQDDGDYQMVARQGSTDLDSLSIHAAPLNSLRLSTKAFLTTTSTDNKCVDVRETTPDQLTLRRNQSAAVVVVPLDDKNQAMLGLLYLTASGPSFVKLDSPLVGQGVTPNKLRIAPNGTLGQKATITITEVGFNKTLSFDLQTVDEDAPLTCAQQ